MRVVLDASAAVEIALRHDRAVEFGRLLQEADEVLAPELLVAEVVNTVWKYHQFEKLSATVCDHALERAIGLVDRLIPGERIYREAFLLARAGRRPAHDMFYLAVARREDAALLTTDVGLRREAARQGIRVA
jgi:predicted nucleic acid-binding protein